jgi:hypothetical protein
VGYSINSFSWDINKPWGYTVFFAINPVEYEKKKQ